MWEELFGANEAIIQERLDSIEENITTLVNDMVREEEETKREYITKYEELLKEAKTLEAELAINVPRRDVKKEPLCIRIKTLEDDLEAHRLVRNERMLALQNLQQEESKLCAKLLEPCTYAELKSVPSEAKLSEIRKHIDSLNSTLKSRQAQYSTLRTQVLNLWTKLELEPEGSFELEVESNNLENLLGTENLTNLEALVGKLEDAETKMNEELEILRYKLSTLWNRLNTDSREREIFLTVNNRCCVSSLTAFKEQIEVCTALKLTRIKEIVGAIRDELQDWWEKAHFGEEQRDQFVQFKLEHDITEEVLEQHEREVENVKLYFDNNRDTIELLEQRFALWEEMVLLEDKANDKDRLFSNRGGKLLMEEKKRKFIQKELPKLERKLDKLFDAYEARCGHAFLFDGEDAREMIAKQWEARNKTKENVKQAKKNVVATATTARSRLLGPPGQNLTARQTPDRNGTLKRKGEATPLLESKRRLLSSATKNDSDRTNGRLLSAVRKPQVKGSSPTPSLPTYSMFQNQLDGNAALNSTYDSKSSGSTKVTRSTPVPNRSKLPARSKMLSPKVRSKLPMAMARTPITPAGGTTFTRSRSHLTLTPRNNATLTRSRSQAQLTTATPKHKQLPFIF